MPLVYVVAIIWLNAYICRDWLTHPTAWMNSLHGSQAALARNGVSWTPQWWPYWDCGIPLEFTSAPLVPAIGHAIIAVRHISPLLAYQTVSAIFYCAAPLALFLLGWSMTSAPGWSFFAALFYSLLSPAQILAPEGKFTWAGFLEPHRFKLQGVWDETPHCAALAFLLIFVLFLVRAIDSRRATHLALAAIALALAILAWPFAIFGALLTAMCLFSIRGLAGWRALAAILWALTIASRFLPPSLWNAIGVASAAHDPWSFGIVKCYAGIAVVWFTLEHFLRRAKDWRLPFFALWAFAMSAPPLLQVWFVRLVMPEAHRFRLEMEAAVALLIVFGARALIDRMPRVARVAVAAIAIACALPLTIAHRRAAKDVLYPADATRTVEYRTAQRIPGGVRVLAPGSIGHWADLFTPLLQFGGAEGTMAYNQVQQQALKSVFEGKPDSTALLNAYGVGAIVVPGASSAEFWKPFSHPEAFSTLPVLSNEEGIAIYAIPQAAASLTWRDRNHFRVHTLDATVAVSYHPGWRASIAGRRVEVRPDRFGLMQLPSSEPADVDFAYDGGLELRLCGWLTILATLSAVWVAVRGGLR